VDKVLQISAHQHGDVDIKGEVDRVYANLKSKDFQVPYGAEQGGVQLHLEGLSDVVVWNPWTEKAAGMADFGNDEFHKMICVEAGQVAEFIALAAGGSWEGSQVLSLL
jgi:glucose-6-phosphate 1-epimerase